MIIAKFQLEWDFLCTITVKLTAYSVRSLIQHDSEVHTHNENHVHVHDTSHMQATSTCMTVTPLACITILRYRLHVNSGAEYVQ